MTAPHPGRRRRAIAAAVTAALALTGALAAPAAAQQDSQDTPRILTPAGLPCTFDSCVLRLEDGWFSRKLVRGPEGTVVARLGIGGPSLESVVAISDSAVVHARRYRSAQNTGTVLTTLGSLGTIAAIVVLNQREGDMRDESIAVNVAGLALWATGRTLQLKAHRELERSLWWYNRAVSVPPQAR